MEELRGSKVIYSMTSWTVLKLKRESVERLWMRQFRSMDAYAPVSSSHVQDDIKQARKKVSNFG